ncbi:MAG: hypothetical protein HY308_15190 [Gammaproteobacteria bacterium]|nr:hypothetical protein [Gammaproteobacteria bacterium]
MSHSSILLAKRLAGELEPWTGWLASLKTPGYSDDPNVVGMGEGIYTADDWSRTRRQGLASFGTDGTQFDSDDNYLRYIFSSEGMNVVAAISLARVFDFNRYRSIFEIGCGDMSQAYVLHRLYPQKRYVATDLDPYVIDRCSRLSVLAGIEKSALNVLAIDEGAAPFAGFDLLMSWGMEYALDDTQLLRLLKLVRRHRVPYLMCSATALGLGKYVRHLLFSSKRKRLLNERRLRFSGWERSVRHFSQLARTADLRLKVIGRFGFHFCMLYEPAS